MSGRRDRSFYTYRQTCQFLFKLARRCSSPSVFPSDENWPKILDLDLKTTSALSVPAFLDCMKFNSKPDVACKVRAERDKQDKKNATLTVKSLTKMNKHEFGKTARSYVTFLFNSVQKTMGLSSDIIKGLGCFDLEMLLNGPKRHAIYCHLQLFTTFRLRKFFTDEEETMCCEEYESILENLRRNYPNLVQPTVFESDTETFLMESPSLRNRPLLFKLFRLACLCLEEPFQNLPAVNFGFVDSEDPTSSLVYVILSVQSYYRNVPHGIEAMTSDKSIAAFLQLEPNFGGSGLSDVYCPWKVLISFGVLNFWRKLIPARRVVKFKRIMPLPELLLPVKL